MLALLVPGFTLGCPQIVLWSAEQPDTDLAAGSDG